MSILEAGMNDSNARPQAVEPTPTCKHGKAGPHGIGVAHPMDSFPIYFCPGPGGRA